MISLKVNEDSLNAVLLAIQRKVAKTVQKTTDQIYKNIVTLDHSSVTYHHNAPYWSGQYMQSWRINESFVDGSFASPRDPVENSYKFPNVDNNNFVYSGGWNTVHISNSAPHAAKLETQGSPKHKHPWMVAHHSVSTAVNQLRLY